MKNLFSGKNTLFHMTSLEKGGLKF